jgi:hypothetical protein
MKITRDNWLIEAGQMQKGDRLMLYPCGDLNATTALAALEAQYGAGRFDTDQHGQALYVRCGWAFPRFGGELYRRFNAANEALYAMHSAGITDVAAFNAAREKVVELRRIWEKVKD